MNPSQIESALISKLLFSGLNAFLALGVVSGSAQAFSLSATNDANTLVNSILGSGITVLNASYTGTSDSSAVFTGGASTGIGINSGVILSTGRATDAAGPGDSSDISATNGLPGDLDLDALIPGFTTFDATILEFEFQFGDGSGGGDLFFNYAFASEEYNEFVNTDFNDVFGLFVDGVNVAIAPDGNPVSINNVNCGNPFSGSGPNCDSFNNNESGVFDIEYDGFTDVFLAQALGLSPGTHTLKLAIADAGDTILDSALFIQGGSLSDDIPTTDVPEPATVMGTLVASAMGLLVDRKRRQRGN